MWLISLIALIQVLMAQTPIENQPSPDPATVLWDKGLKASQTSNWKEASESFLKLTKDFPATKHFVDAQFELGRSYFELHQPEAAIEPLKYFSTRRLHSAQGREARLLLGCSYLATGKPQEAYLISHELLKLKPLSQEERVRSLLLKGSASWNRRRSKDTQSALRSLEHEIKKLSPGPLATELRSETRWLQIQLATFQCGKLPTQEPLNEEQTRDQYQRRGICHLESINHLLQGALEKDERNWFQQSAQGIAEAMVNYQEACNHLPPPEGKRTSLELQRYQEELGVVIQAQCRSTKDRALTLLATWEDRKDLDAAYRSEFEKLHNEIERKWN